MYTQCTTQKAAEQQRVLKEALLTLTQRRAYEKITVSALCETAGVSRKTFYRLFETKEDVLCALVDGALEGYMPLMPFAPPDSVHTGERYLELRHFLLYWRTQKPMMDVLNKGRRTELLVQRCMAWALLVPAEVYNRFGLTAGSDSAEQMLFFFCGLSALLVKWHESGYAKPVDEMAALLYRLLTTPLCASHNGE